jgi:hypothetical protein
VEPKAPKKRGPAPTFDKRVSLYENEEGVRLLEELARLRGQTQAGLVRLLIREEAKRRGLIDGEPVS